MTSTKFQKEFKTLFIINQIQFCVTVITIHNLNKNYTFISMIYISVWKISVRVGCSFFIVMLCSSCLTPQLHPHPETKIPLPLLYTPPSPFCFQPSVWSTVYCLPAPPPPPDCLLFVTFFFSRSPASHLLSVSIGGHGLGKPTEQLQNVEELLFSYFSVSMEDGGTSYQ